MEYKESCAVPESVLSTSAFAQSRGASEPRCGGTTAIEDLRFGTVAGYKKGNLVQCLPSGVEKVEPLDAKDGRVLP